MRRFRVPERYWRGGKCPLGVEYRHEPSAFALDYFFYVHALGRSSTPPRFHHEHLHEDRLLIHYIKRGELWHRVGTHTHRVRAGQVCVMDLREPVSYGNDGSRSATNWWVLCGGRDLPHFMTRLGVDEKPVCDLTDAPAFERLFGSLLGLVRDNPPAFEARADGVLRLLCAELLAARTEVTGMDYDLVTLPRPAATLSPPVRDVIRYIARFYNAEKPLTFKGLCSVSGLSRFYFARLFRRETGLSPMHFVDAYRIEKAKLVLASSHYPIAAVAAMVGVSNPSKFSRLFLQRTGVTPRKFRAAAIQPAGSKRK